MITGIVSVTIGVSDLDESLRLFRDLMGMTVEHEDVITPELAAAWRLDEGVTGRLLMLSCNGYQTGRIRLAEFNPTPTKKVRRHNGPGPLDSALDIGPKAIDFYVNDPISKPFKLITGAGYPARSEPVKHEVGNMISEEFVCWGPDGVPLLYMVGHRHNEQQIRHGSADGGFSEVATISVVGADISKSRQFYVETLGLNTVTDAETEPEFLELANELTGVPKGTPIHWLLYGGEGDPSGKTLVVNFAGVESKRLRGRMRPGHLGFSLMTHYTDDLDSLLHQVEANGFDVFSPPVEVTLGSRKYRTMLVVGPNEEMLELVEDKL